MGVSVEAKRFPACRYHEPGIATLAALSFRPQNRKQSAMKIKSVAAFWVHIPIPPERQHTSDFGRTLSFDGTLVRIDTECGITGWGEAKAQVGGMAQNQALTCMINDEFAPLLKGEDPRDITRL